MIIKKSQAVFGNGVNVIHYILQHINWGLVYYVGLCGFITVASIKDW